jgi:hypothetical protein
MKSITKIFMTKYGINYPLLYREVCRVLDFPAQHWFRQSGTKLGPAIPSVEGALIRKKEC